MNRVSGHARGALLALTVLLLHLALFSDLKVLGVAPELPLALAVTAGLVGGSERGAVAGFAIGLGIDLYLPTLFGLSAFIYAVWGYSVGLLEERIFRSAWWINVTITAIATMVGLLTYALLGELLGETNLYTDNLYVVMGVAALYSLVLSVPLLGMWRWSWPTLGRPRR
ncbi:MAG: rod shape-determining protein MreD [Acidimicrobiia bacterium]|nr:rod shape-determining protein MreD [Acidimicrobiia bacterium]MYC58113.1 rod shape-determining protein MreD [Acidimicrobiia bacterium]MYG94397.1 rod shape-determining protein MreD [Acidimicrobiia bacterium]MYI30545.1 rod shape-determining protein MreD [Acidimicrobiia bacterium]